MIKIIHNNLIIDVNRIETYVRYLPLRKRFVVSNKEVANGILGSDGNTIYHLEGTINNFPEGIKTVRIQKINEEEYEEITNKIILENSQTEELKNEVNSLKELVSEQKKLLEQLLAKLN